MSQKVWSPENATLLRQLREQAGVDQISLAAIHAMSINQVKQLEDGGESCFYSSAIKFNAGKKLLAYFGEDLEVKEPSECLSEINSESKAANQPDPVQVSCEQTEKRSERHSEFVADTKIVSTEKGLATEASKSPAYKNEKTYKILVIIFICLIASTFQVKNPEILASIFQTEHGKKVPPLIVNPLPIKNESDNPGASPTQIPSPLPAAVTATAVLVVTPEAVFSNQVQDQEFECKWTVESVNVFAPSPSKEGNYLHFDAQKSSNACVLDSDMKLTVLRMGSKQGQTVRGKQPFKVYSPTLSNFKIFYQGSVIKLPSSDTKIITLNEKND